MELNYFKEEDLKGPTKKLIKDEFKEEVSFESYLAFLNTISSLGSLNAIRLAAAIASEEEEAVEDCELFDKAELAEDIYMSAWSDCVTLIDKFFSENVFKFKEQDIKWDG